MGAALGPDSTAVCRTRAPPSMTKTKTLPEPEPTQICLEPSAATVAATPRANAGRSSPAALREGSAGVGDEPSSLAPALSQTF